MSTITLIVSDLHLADDVSILDCFGSKQQQAFEGFLYMFSAMDSASEVELIINGDCFDFLVTTPYSAARTGNEQTALHKIARIIAAHRPFFAALRSFIASPGRSIMFMTGNHDLELCFAGVRSALCMAMVETTDDPRIHFCPARFYRPLSNLHIEHGNYFDFWNHAIQDLWNERGEALDRAPRELLYSPGSRYFQAAAYPISLRYAYFDHFEPSFNSIRQIALLCLLDPELVVETARRTMQLLSYPREALANLASGDERVPVRLFEAAMLDFVAFDADMREHKPDWIALPDSEQSEQTSQEALREFLTTQAALTLTPVEAIAALCELPPYQMGEAVAQGMHAILAQEPTLRYAIAGHTHQVRVDRLLDGAQVYLNTGSWTTHLAVPAPSEVTPALVDWLRAPDWEQVPLRDVTQLTFALVTAQDNVATDAYLCVWEGGVNGRYRRLT